jgi:hypothetical protein
LVELLILHWRKEVNIFDNLFGEGYKFKIWFGAQFLEYSDEYHMKGKQNNEE